MNDRKLALPVLLLFFAVSMSVSGAGAQAQSSAKKKTATGAAATHKPASKTSSSTTSGKTTGKKGKKSSRRQPGQKAPSTDRISEIQTALVKNGSYSGTPTGKWDDSTVSAIKKYQAGHGLNPTGRLDAPTLQKLGLGSTTAGVAAPQTPPGAVSRLTSSKLNTVDPSAENQR